MASLIHHRLKQYILTICRYLFHMRHSALMHRYGRDSLLI
jgi:hypothetical protein